MFPTLIGIFPGTTLFIKARLLPQNPVDGVLQLRILASSFARCAFHRLFLCSRRWGSYWRLSLLWRLFGCYLILGNRLRRFRRGNRLWSHRRKFHLRPSRLIRSLNFTPGMAFSCCLRLILNDALLWWCCYGYRKWYANRAGFWFA